MKGKLLVAVAVGAIMALSAAPTAVAAMPNVNMSLCRATVGQTTAPAGIPVTFGDTWVDTKRSAASHFLRLQRTTATVDGVPVTNASSQWDPVSPSGASGGSWATSVSLNAGVLANPGDSFVVTFDIVLTKRLRGGDGTVHQAGSIYGGPITCTITAV